MKGYHVSRLPGHATKNGALNWKKGKPHDLVQMAADFEFNITEREMTTLRTLTYIARVSGRYPVPMKSTETAVVSFGHKDQAVTAELIKRLFECIKTLAKGRKYPKPLRVEFDMEALRRM